MAADDKGGSMTGLTEEEAKEFNKWMMLGFGFYVTIAVLAHAAVWSQRPWFNHWPETSTLGLQELGQNVLAFFA